MKTAISIPDNLFLAAEKLADRLGLSRSALFQNALRSFLQEHRDEGVTEGLNAVYKKSDRSSRLDPLLEQLQGASLAAEDWE
ncbi:MAG: ChpI protein [Candidatus Krumholzibacteria bacterium]|nr:ChpI protein [Candidatus Krumholzibacteria bacterium]